MKLLLVLLGLVIGYTFYLLTTWLLASMALHKELEKESEKDLSNLINEDTK